jgi:glycosyltransferase involved in cell wall biosynthesis
MVKLMNPSVTYFHCDRVLREEFSLHKWGGGPSDYLRIFTCTGPKPYKGLLDLLGACSFMAKSCAVRIELRVAGSPSGFLTRDVRSLGIPHKALAVEWLGPVGASAVAEELASCSMYVHPSRIENSPNSVAEAQMVGCPVVATDVGGTSSLVEHTVTGVLAAAGDVPGLAATMGTVARDRGLAASLGKNARTVACRRHDRRRIAQATMDCYSAILEPRVLHDSESQRDAGSVDAGARPACPCDQ